MYDAVVMGESEAVAVVSGQTVPDETAKIEETAPRKMFNNQLAAAPFDYDFKTNHAACFGGADGYLCSKEASLASIVQFMKEWV